MNYKHDPYSMQLSVTRDPAVATSLSVIPGLGQIYNSETRKGLLFLLVGMTNIFLLGLLSWSKQLVSALSAFSSEFNIRPNGDIVNALSNFHPGSPSMTMLVILFVAFIGYAMRDAYDHARTVKRNAIYAPVVMHMDEASSGSYLFHAALMATLVLFAFFFLLPTPTRPQVTVIEFLNPKIETQIKQKTKNLATKRAEALRDPNLKQIVQNPSQNANLGAQSPHRTSLSKPTPQNKPAEASKSAEAPKQSAPAKTEPVKESKPVETKPAASAPPAQPAKPNIRPIAPQSASAPTPNPIKPPVLRPVALPALMPQAPANQPKAALDPAKMLEGLMPMSAPSKPSQVPAPTGVAVKSTNGAPVLVASNIAPAGFGRPQPGIAIPVRSTGATTPNIIDTGSRSNKSSHGTDGPAPRGALKSNGDDLAMVTPVGGNKSNSEGSNRTRTKGPSASRTTGPNGNDDGALDKFAGLKPSVPGHDTPGGKDGQKGTSDGSKIGESQPKTEREVDFSLYMANLQRRIKRAWFPPKCPSSKRITVRFNISRNGTLHNLKLVSPSGESLNDQAAMKAVMNAAPFAPLPDGSPEDVDIEFKFDYNVFNSTGTTNFRRF
jgi:TonB family protein